VLAPLVPRRYTRIMWRALSSTGIILLLLSSAAEAQSPNSFDGLRAQGLVQAGETVYVTDASGRRSKGRLQRVQADSILVTIDGRPRTYTAADITRIQRGDSVANGMLIGLGAGIGAAIITTQNLCGTIDSDDECAVIANVAVGIPVAAGGLALGALADALRHRTIWTASSTGRIGVWPILAAGRRGLAFSVGF
jgi:hypothetical protein